MGNQLKLDKSAEFTVERDDITVQFNGSGGVTVLKNGVTAYQLPANDTQPKAAATPRNDGGKKPKGDNWLTKEFLESAKQGQRLPDGSVHILDKRGVHWALAAEVATPRSYGWGKDLGDVGKWVENQNTEKTHGHSDWEMPNNDVGAAIYKNREEGELKVMFASVRGLWLAEHDNNNAIVQWFDDGIQFDVLRASDHSVCVARRLVI